MNLWHQRVIIFFTKVLAVCFGLIFFGYFLYYNLYFKTDTLIKYVPKDSFFYATFRLTPELQQNTLVNRFMNQIEKGYKVPNIEFKQINQLVGNNFSIAMVPEQNDASKFNVLFLVDLGITPKNTDEIFNIAKQNKWQAHVISNKTSSTHVLVITPSVELMEQVKQTAIKQSPALSQKIDVVLNLKKFSPNDFNGKVYLAKDKLDLFIVNEQNPKYKLLIKSLISKSSQPLYLGLVSINNNLYLQNNADSKFDYWPQIGKSWPENIKYSLVSDNLAAKAESLLVNLKQTDLKYYNQLLTNIKFFEELYDFNLEQDIFPLISQHVQIIVNNDHQYLVALNLESAQTDQISVIEKLIKTFIANNYPVIKNKLLPDKTYISTVVRDISNLDFEEDELRGLKIKSIIKENDEFVYLFSDNHLILANSRQIIIELLHSDQQIQAWENAGLINNSSNFSENVWFNLTNLPLNNDILEVFSYIYLEEDVINNTFRLILE